LGPSVHVVEATPELFVVAEVGSAVPPLEALKLTEAPDTLFPYWSSTSNSADWGRAVPGSYVPAKEVRDWTEEALPAAASAWKLVVTPAMEAVSPWVPAVVPRVQEVEAVPELLVVADPGETEPPPELTEKVTIPPA
jgi:hypothetical protein